MDELASQPKTIGPEDYIPYVSGILWAVDEQLRYLDIEGHRLNDWNLAKSDVIGKTVQEFHQEPENGTNTKNHRLALSAGELTYEVEFGGTSYYCRLHYLPDRRMIVGVATDITEEIGLKRRISQQEHALAELSVPVVPVLEHAVIVPVNGQLTVERVRFMEQHIIRQVHQMPKVKAVIIDFSGVSEVESGGTAALGHIYQALKLIGIETILTGMTPKLSQALVTGGTTLKVDRIYSTLKSAVSVLAKEQ